MSSFLDRLKKKNVIPTTPQDEKREKIDAQNKPATPAAATPVAEQLKVDIFQTTSAVIIYAQIAGATVHDYGVIIEGDGDIVTIKGKRSRPNGEHFHQPIPAEKERVLEECSWGDFYRQIILPAEVDSAKAEANMKDGVLMLFLPLKTVAEKGIRLNIVSI
jgi:HSP20 family protein